LLYEDFFSKKNFLKYKAYLQISTSGEGTLTDRTRIWFFTGMCTHMNLLKNARIYSLLRIIIPSITLRGLQNGFLSV